VSYTGIPAEPLASALFLLLALGAAGVVHVWWLRRVTTGFLMRPLDCGLSFRRRRIFGDNKRLRGMVAMPVAAAAIFWLAGSLSETLPMWLALGMWDLSPGRLALLGGAAGLAFMVGELPNSFFKRQLGIAPGQLPQRGWARWLCPLLDRIDSILGTLLVVSLLVPVSVMTWFWLMLIGPAVHALFSAVLFRLRIKERAL
jgi:CDP-2,3-bis-(O-geranylgeranyl)-sn-glycerol synthase